MKQYLELFLEESNEHLQSINDQLLKLEQEPENNKIVVEIFRSAHTVKGMSAKMGYQDIANLTHEMENVLNLLRNGIIKVNQDVQNYWKKWLILLAKEGIEKRMFQP